MKNCFILLILLLTGFACKQKSHREEVKEIISEWVGKVVTLPSDVLCFRVSEEVPCITPTNTPYKVLLYVDSMGCY